MKKSKPVEWKDTRFSFSKKYEYSLFVKNRCLFFHCLAKNVRKMINYAYNFARYYNICVIYVYGAVKKNIVQKLLDEKKFHIILLAASEFSSEDVKTIAEYDKWLNALKNQGLLKVINHGVPKGKYSKVIVGKEYGNEPSEEWFEMYNCPEWEGGYKVYTDGMELMERYQNALKSIETALNGKLDVLANFPVTDTVSGSTERHSGDLLNIIKGIYPYGVEADTDNEYAVKLLKIKKLVPAAFSDEASPDVQKLDIHFADGAEQLCFWNTVTEGASKCLEFLESYCSKAIAEKGCLSLSEMWFEFSKPPYGAYECNWYCYIYALALKKYNTPDYFYGSSMYAARNDNDLPNINPKYLYGYIFVQTEKQERFKRLLAKLFDIENPPEATRMLITKIAMGWVTENIKLAPLDCIDHRFHEIFVKYGEKHNTECNYNGRFGAWYEFGYEKYLSWLEENFDDLYGRIRKLDENFRTALAKKYGQKLADFYCEIHTVKGGAVGWLHTKNMIEESVEKYMSSLICCECGRVISSSSFKESAHIWQAHDENGIIDFTVKDIIGINKKLLGRERGDMYLCVPCLAEFAECSEVRLGEMIHEFKEQGCTLF